GALPALLGFPLPDVETIRASAVPLELEAARQAWAGWLLGVLLVYGLLPRLLLALFSLWRWRRGRARLALDLGLPGYQLLRERLQPGSDRRGVSDQAPATLAEPVGGARLGEASGAVLVAIELDPARDWPPSLPKGVADAGVLDSREQRRHLL